MCEIDDRRSSTKHTLAIHDKAKKVAKDSGSLEGIVGEGDLLDGLGIEGVEIAKNSTWVSGKSTWLQCLPITEEVVGRHAEPNVVRGDDLEVALRPLLVVLDALVQILVWVCGT